MDKLQALGTGLMNWMGFGSPTIKPFVSTDPRRIADKDSLRWSAAWHNSWDDERMRRADIANATRDERGYHQAIGFAAHPVNASFSSLPSGVAKLSPTDKAYFLHTPDYLRDFKPVFVQRYAEPGSDNLQ